MTIDLDTLREMLAEIERAASYYERDCEKKYAGERFARCRHEAEVLRHVIAYHEGRIYAREEAMAQLARELGDELAEEVAA